MYRSKFRWKILVRLVGERGPKFESRQDIKSEKSFQISIQDFGKVFLLKKV